MFRIELSKHAARFFEEANAALQRRLDRCFDILRRDPYRHPNIKALEGKFAGHRRFRSGDYRIVYRIEHAPRLVLVTAIAHRRDVYE